MPGGAENLQMVTAGVASETIMVKVCYKMPLTNSFRR